MKNAIFILSFIIGTLVLAQDSDSTNFQKQQYYDLVNYVPINLKPDSIHDLESKLPYSTLNSIGVIQAYSGYREELELSEHDRQWLDKRISQIATALYQEGKRILISPVGGYSGCPDEMIDTLYLNNIKIIDLKFCHTCTDASRISRFIKIFNDRMYTLMNIEPPDRKTILFFGNYQGRNKDRFKMKLILNEDRTFQFSANKRKSSFFSEGLWNNKNDTLMLISRNLSENEKINFALANKSWLKFNDLKFLLVKGRLIELNGGSWKLRQTYIAL
ncbi:hypothetical protein [Brumimicrobium mesophilum]|uniref:hypothetical protein n=1 Tax=Brumimicrobium mesophilum TaxID=392717 RepID=UPI00131DE8B6|nr:hypothetical protein [Brumimicrobium mesophilum]